MRFGILALFFVLSVSVFAQDAITSAEVPAAEPASVPEIATPAEPVDSVPISAVSEATAPAEFADSVPVVEMATPVEPPAAAVEPPPVVVEEPPVPATPVAVVETVAPIVASSSKSFIGLAPRISGGLSGFYGHRRVNDLRLRASYSFGGGIIAIVPIIEDLLYLDPAVQYAFLRTHTEWSKSGLYGENKKTATVVNHSVEVPILFRFATPVGFFAEIGPQISFTLSSKTETETSSLMGEKDSHNTPDLNMFNLSGAFGIGYNIIEGFSIDIRGQYGFFEYAKDTYGKPWIVHLGLRYQVF